MLDHGDAMLVLNPSGGPGTRQAVRGIKEMFRKDGLLK